MGKSITFANQKYVFRAVKLLEKSYLHYNNRLQSITLKSILYVRNC